MSSTRSRTAGRHRYDPVRRLAYRGDRRREPDLDRHRQHRRTGNTLANLITGNAGNNILDGGLDVLADTLSGGLGNDTYIVRAGDVLVEAANAGTDTVQTALTYTLALNFENLTLTGTDNVNATGNALDNILTGNAGNNILNGLIGADTMLGGLGNDTYVLDNAGDIVNDSGGSDTIQSSVTVDLTDAVHVVGDIETLTLTGTAAINGIGNALANTITGNGANNLIEGGLGADTLDGGLGTDTVSYAHSAAGVLVSLLTTAQVSTGDASGDILKNFENITGSAFATTLTGNTLANLLDGGAGADTLVGGAGNDIYILDNAGDVVDEVSNGGAGIDTIQSGVSHTLETGVET